MDIITKDNEDKRVMYVSPTSKFYAKDRTGSLDKIVKPEYGYIHKQIADKQKSNPEPENVEEVEEPKKTVKKVEKK
jgi:hypothetical protein